MQAVQILSLAVSIVLLVVVIDFIRRGLLKEKYSILWLASIFAIIVFSLWKSLLHKVAGLLGVAYPPSLLFLVAFAFVLLILLHYSVVISVLTDRNKRLTQELTLLKAAFKKTGCEEVGEKKEGE
ncbi:MAG: DUF2304 domain-containing protein [Planctomycetota bacterium]|jgi:hypothetical protein